MLNVGVNILRNFVINIISIRFKSWYEYWDFEKFWYKWWV
jgi:hypothetical protein